MENTGEAHVHQNTSHTVITIIRMAKAPNIGYEIKHRCLDCEWWDDELVDW